MDLLGLFTSALLAATLLPGGSEVVLFYLNNLATHGFWTLVAVAAAGNTLGGMISYAMGRIIPPHRTSAKKIERAVARINRYGPPVLLLSWVPVVGDVLCVAAGWTRMNWIYAALFIGTGKTLRYVLVLAAF